MEPRPDHGEATCKGFGRLAGKVALVRGDDGIGPRWRWRSRAKGRMVQRPATRAGV